MTDESVQATDGFRLVDVIPGRSLGWIAPTPKFMQRTSHAVRGAHGVWLFDPVFSEPMITKAQELGAIVGVVQLLDRHPRDCAMIANQLGVPLYVLPDAAPASADFQVLEVTRRRVPRWREIAAWFPDSGILCVPEALGGAPYFRARGEVVGPHPVLRLLGPPRRLSGLTPTHVLCGHGTGLHAADAGGQIDRAITDARRRIPSWFGRLVRPSGASG